MSSRIIDYVALSEAVYSRNELDQSLAPENLGFVKRIPDPVLQEPDAVYQIPEDDLNTGFYAETFEKGGRLVIVLRGTDFNDASGTDFGLANIPLALGDPSAAQWQAAMRY